MVSPPLPSVPESAESRSGHSQPDPLCTRIGLTRTVSRGADLHGTTRHSTAPT
jgi:hypothetical protein